MKGEAVDLENPGAFAASARRLGIDSAGTAVLYIGAGSRACTAHGLQAGERVTVTAGAASVAALVNVVDAGLLAEGEAGLSEFAWKRLDAQPGRMLQVAPAAPARSFSVARSKIYGQDLSVDGANAIIMEIAAGLYSDIQIAAFITACAGKRLKVEEVFALTGAMVQAGARLDWPAGPIVDKHCVGGLPGNRTTLVVVPIVAACGLVIPKTSSRAITSPAGTADAMEALAPVDLDTVRMRRVVEQEGGCIVWGGAVNLSPADDMLIRVARPLDFDGEAQLVASILSKKLAAGSTHVLIDMPVGPSAKVRTPAAAESLSRLLHTIGQAYGLTLRTVISDGSQPVGRGIGPALEARDALAVLQGAADAPQDLRARSLSLAGQLLELGGKAGTGEGLAMAQAALDGGAAWRKFQAICAAQGGMREPPLATCQHTVEAARAGRVATIDNRRLARVAKLAGAPQAPGAGLLFEAPLGSRVVPGQPLFTVHAASPGALADALAYAAAHEDIVAILEAP
jgi:thymidine phosphorylase